MNNGLFEKFMKLFSILLLCLAVLAYTVFGGLETITNILLIIYAILVLIRLFTIFVIKRGNVSNKYNINSNTFKEDLIDKLNNKGYQVGKRENNTTLYYKEYNDKEIYYVLTYETNKFYLRSINFLTNLMYEFHKDISILKGIDNVRYIIIVISDKESKGISRMLKINGTGSNRCGVNSAIILNKNKAYISSVKSNNYVYEDIIREAKYLIINK